MLRRFALIGLVLCCSAPTVYAAANTAAIERVVAVKPDGSLVLSRSGNAVLANILFPDAPRAEAWLAEHVLQQEIHVVVGESDRYGRTQITSDVAEKMLRDGVAVYYATEGDIQSNWKPMEDAARAANRGVWVDKNLISTPENAAQHIGEFQVVEGTITRIYEGKKETYLNFGGDWHSDFSITIPGKVRRSMKAQLSTLKAGDKIRVRGAIYEENGPMIKLMNADNITRY